MRARFRAGRVRPIQPKRPRLFALTAIAAVAGCATQTPPPLATPETFRTEPCEDLVRLKYDREVELLKLSANLQRTRAAASQRSSESDGLSRLGDSLANLGHTLRINEISDEMTALRVEVAAIDYNLSNRCRQGSAPAVLQRPAGGVPADPD